jgi:hypothetical protein
MDANKPSVWMKTKHAQKRVADNQDVLLEAVAAAERYHDLLRLDVITADEWHERRKLIRASLGFSD